MKTLLEAIYRKTSEAIGSLSGLQSCPKCKQEVRDLLLDILALINESGKLKEKKE